MYRITPRLVRPLLAEPLLLSTLARAAPLPALALEYRYKSCSTRQVHKAKHEDPKPNKKGQSIPLTEPCEAFDLETLTSNMERAVERCGKTVGTLVGSLGRADPALLDSVRVEYGGSKQAHPLGDFATVGVRDGGLIVSCFDVDMVKNVERGIYAANLGLTPQTGVGEDENVLRVPIPKPTSETRQARVKDITRICENARVSIRSARHSAQKQIKTDIDNKVVSKPQGDKDMKKIEAETKKFTSQVDAVFEKTKKALLSAV